MWSTAGNCEVRVLYFAYSWSSLLQSNVIDLKCYTWTKDLLKENFSIKRLSIFTLFWDWIKCHASDGSFFRIEVRTSGATDISIYNPNPIIQCPRNGTFLTGTKNKKNFIKANSCSNRLSKGKAPSKLSSKLSSALASNSAKNKHKSIVFKHIQWICVFSEKRTSLPFNSVVWSFDHLRKNSSSSSSSSSNSKTNTRFCVHTYLTKYVILELKYLSVVMSVF